MKIVMIGTGNVAAVLGRKLKIAGHQVLQVFGRNKEVAASLAKELDANACNEWNAIQQHAEIYIIALSDKVLLEIDQYLQLKTQLVVHTAGSVSIEVLKNISVNYGVFYPFQTIRKEVTLLPEIPLFIDASNEASRQKLMEFAKTISPKVSEADDQQRIQYHLCAIIVNNFSNYFYAVAENYCNTHGMDFKNLLPLIEETAARLRQFSPRQVQTGPAIRNDAATVEKHMALLEGDQRLQNLYKLVTENILLFNWQQV